MITKYAPLNFNDHNLTQLQNKLTPSLQSLLATPILDGLLLEAVELQLGTNKVPHKLGRKIRGYIVTSSSGVASFADTIATAPADGTSYLTITASAATTINLWVF